MNIRDISNKIKNKEISVVELTTEYLYNAEKSKLNTFISVNENALANANEIDSRIARQEKLSPLAGIPFGVKDNIITKGIKTTAASKMLYNYIPDYNAEVIDRLSDSIIIGKLNMDEFSMGSDTETSYFGRVKNPVNPEYISGGSSGGSAAAVKNNEVVFALGSDTGGSIRQPCAYCGVYGLKPTYGLVSRYGLISFASSLDTIGPVAGSIEDCAFIMNAIAGFSNMDTTCTGQRKDYLVNLNKSIKNLKVGFIKDIENIMENEVKDYMNNVYGQFEKFCGIISLSQIPEFEYIHSIYHIISCSEAYSNLGRYDGFKYGYRSLCGNNFDEILKNTRDEGFGETVKQRINSGKYYLNNKQYFEYSLDENGLKTGLNYKAALEIRHNLIMKLTEIFEKVDIIVAPVSPLRVYKTGETHDPIYGYYEDLYNGIASLCGLPAIEIPSGTDSRGLPMGFQIIGKPYSEDILLRVAQMFENRR